MRGAGDGLPVSVCLGIIQGVQSCSEFKNRVDGREAEQGTCGGVDCSREGGERPALAPIRIRNLIQHNLVASTNYVQQTFWRRFVEGAGLK